jgi:deazaflavin-dependent oxidoreductase (nitroreductase family)
MDVQGAYEPSPWKFAADQVALYESTGGAEGGTLQGKPVIILTTRGRHSDKVRKTPLMRVEHGGTYAVVASMGGAPKHPVWYLNLTASPAATLQDGHKIYEMRARGARGREGALVGAGRRGVAGVRGVPGQDGPTDPGRRARADSVISLEPGTNAAHRPRARAPVRGGAA